MTLYPGQLLQQGRYTIQHQLGRGGMGTVYLAIDNNLDGQRVAIKQNSLTSDKARAQFKHEAILLSRLNHPNLPKVTDHFVEPSGDQFLVMNYIEGENLDQLLEKHTQGASSAHFSETEIVAWILSVIDALAYMHGRADPETGTPQPVIHRDIKPSNIKRTPKGDIILVDFGLARFEADTMTHSGARGSTPGYSPIEQSHGGTDARSDIYSLGATLYKLLTGQRPPSSSEIAAGKPLLSPRRYNPRISRQTERVIMRAMQMRPEDRYQRVQAMRKALRQPSFIPWPLRGQRKHADHNSKPSAPNRNHLTRRTISLPLTLAFLLVGLLLVGSVGYAAYLTIEPAAQPSERAQLRPPQIPSQTTSLSEVSALPIVQTAQPTVQEAMAAVTAVTNPMAPTAAETVDTEPMATLIQIPTQKPTSAPTATATRSPATVTPTAVLLQVPTQKPIQTSVPVPTRTSPSPVVRQPPSMGNARTNVDSIEFGKLIQFTWQTPYQPATGETFEVVLWPANRNGENEDTGRGTTDVREVQPSQRGEEWTLQVAIPEGPFSAGLHQWGIWIVRIAPYERLMYLGQASGPINIVHSNSGDGSGSDSGCGGKMCNE